MAQRRSRKLTSPNLRTREEKESSVEVFIATVVLVAGVAVALFAGLFTAMWILSVRMYATSTKHLPSLLRTVAATGVSALFSAMTVVIATLVLIPRVGLPAVVGTVLGAMWLLGLAEGLRRLRLPRLLTPSG